jgi:hypothetical protein
VPLVVFFLLFLIIVFVVVEIVVLVLITTRSVQLRLAQQSAAVIIKQVCLAVVWKHLSVQRAALLGGSGSGVRGRCARGVAGQQMRALSEALFEIDTVVIVVVLEQPEFVIVVVIVLFFGRRCSMMMVILAFGVVRFVVYVILEIVRIVPIRMASIRKTICFTTLLLSASQQVGVRVTVVRGIILVVLQLVCARFRLCFCLAVAALLILVVASFCGAEARKGQAILVVGLRIVVLGYRRVGPLQMRQLLPLGGMR